MFDDYFEVFLADTRESKEIHYSIRYQVYCEELGFENKDDFPLEQEFDQYDNDAIHFIVRHKSTREWVGAVRLTFPIDQTLPLETHCKIHEQIDKSQTTRLVEFSRLCLIKEIRRRFNDILPPHGIEDETMSIKETDKVKLFHSNYRSNRSIIWGLINAAADYCYHHDIPHVYFLTTNALAKILCKGGLNMTLIGDSCQYRGERYPYRMNVAETYHFEAWKKDYKNSYSLFSELEMSDIRLKVA